MEHFKSRIQKRRNAPPLHMGRGFFTCSLTLTGLFDHNKAGSIYNHFMLTRWRQKGTVRAELQHVENAAQADSARTPGLPGETRSLNVH